MAYFLTYLVTQVPGIKGKAGHASLAITHFQPGMEAPVIITRVGFWGSGQVLLEDEILQVGKKKKFFHKTYPITMSEMAHLFKIFNTDRRNKINDKGSREKIEKQGVHDYVHASLPKKKLRTENPKQEDYKSIPGGVDYSLFNFNCKTYVLNVMRQVGIIDLDLNNWLIDIPTRSKGVQPLKLEEIAGEEVLRWSSPFKVSPRLDLSSREEEPDIKEDPDYTKQMNFAIELNEFKSCVSSIFELLSDKAFNFQVEGIDLLRTKIAQASRNLKTQTKTHTDLARVKKEVHEAVVDFAETTQKHSYPLAIRLLDCLKRALRAIGLPLKLSTHQKSRTLIKQFENQYGRNNNESKQDKVKLPGHKKR